MPDFRLIVDAPAAGPWNMSLDEALLECAQTQQIATLRFYQWWQPTLSLGYFQRYADRSLHSASAGCAAVRRTTGGGAILHDAELTYSITMPTTHPLAARAEQLYRAVHQSLIITLAEFGLEAKLYEPPPASPAGRPLAESEPFLCFQRRSVGDVLVGPHKIAGSAQRRRRGAVLQHGSVLLKQSKFAPELPGLSDLNACEIQAARLLEIWPSRLAQTLAFPPGKSAAPLGDRLSAAATEIARTKFAADSWTERR